MKRKKKRKLKKSVKKLLILIPIIAVIAIVCVYGFALKDVSYSSEGYIKIYNSFYQVDEDGKVLKITAVKPKDIPIITGLDIKKASMYNVLETGNKGDIPALTNMFKELDAYKLKPKKIDQLWPIIARIPPKIIYIGP